MKKAMTPGDAAWSQIDPRYLRPAEVDSLLGVADKARDQLRMAAADPVFVIWSARWSPPTSKLPNATAS